MYSSYRNVAILNHSFDTHTSNRVSTLGNLLLSSNQHSINDTLNNSQINYKLLGIVARENSAYESGYEVADHVRNADALIIVKPDGGWYADTEIVINLDKDWPGKDLVGRIKGKYDMGTLVTGDWTLRYPLGNIKSRVYPRETDIDKVIADYKAELKETDTKESNEAEEYAIEPNENYDTKYQGLNDEPNSDSEPNPDAEPDSEGELVGVVAEADSTEVEATESAE